MKTIVRPALVLFLLLTLLWCVAYPLAVTAVGQLAFPDQAAGSIVTKDGKAVFVETQTARSDAEHRYSYSFNSSPLPVT